MKWLSWLYSLPLALVFILTFEEPTYTALFQQDDPVAQCAAGRQLFLEGQAAEALPLVEAGFAHREQATFADPDDLGFCALTLGVLRHGQDNLSGALEAYQVALNIFHASGNRGFEGATLHNMGQVYDNQGQYVEAMKTYQQALAIHREVGDQAMEGFTLNAIGTVYNNQGKYAEALESYQQALVIRRELSDWVNEGVTLSNMGAVYQVKGHNERRLGVKWEQPVAKLREVILAMRAFWDCWQNGTKLNFRGEFFTLTLMTPFFDPGPHDWPDIPIYIAGVNQQMLQLAGELCQGIHIHPLHTARYIKEYALPYLETGLQKSGRQRAEIELSTTAFVVPTDDADKAKGYEAGARQQISFYASTPSYRIVMELHGWSDIAERLSYLAARGQWAEMPALISDDILAEFALRGTWTELPSLVKAKYASLLDRVSYYFPFVPGQNDEGWQASLAGFNRQ